MSAAHCSSGRAWSPIRSPDKGTRVNVLVTQIRDFTPVVRQFTIKRSLRCVTSCCCCIGRGYTHIEGGTASWGPQRVAKRSAGQDCVAVSPSGFGCNAWVLRVSILPRRCEHMRASAVLQVSPCSSCGSKKEPTQSALTKTCPCPVTKSLLHVGDVVVRPQDTSRTPVQAVEPFVGHITSLRSSQLAVRLLWRRVCFSGA